MEEWNELSSRVKFCGNLTSAPEAEIHELKLYTVSQKYAHIASEPISCKT